MPIVVSIGSGSTVGSGVNTYAGLVTTIGGWLNRDDLETKIPDFITLLEARLNRILRTLGMEATDTLTTVGAVNHNLVAGQAIRFIFSTGTQPGGVVGGQRNYFVSVPSATTAKLHLTRADALADTNVVDITSDGTGTQKFLQAVYLGEARLTSLATVTGKSASNRAIRATLRLSSPA